MSSSGKKGKNSQEKLSKLCAKSWWKLKMNDRTKHNEAMKIQLLSPFLYRKLYQSDIWMNWATTSGLLTDTRLMEINELSMEELMYTELVELAVCYLQDRIQSDFSERPSQCSSTLEGVIDNMDKYQKEAQISAVITNLRNESWFQTIKSQLIGCPIIDSKIHSKCDAAILLVAWQVSFYMKAIYQGEELLKEFEENKSFDPESEKNKGIGNEFYIDKKYEQAIITYTNIICNKPYLHIVYCNRAICFIKKQKYRAALADGRRCVTLVPTWFKGQLRYAEALFELGYSKAALEVLLKAKDICEENKHLIRYMNEIKTKIDHNNRVSILSNSSKFDKVDDNDDDIDDDNDEGSESDDVPALLTDSEDSSHSDYEDTYGKKLDRKKESSKEESKPKKPLPGYIIGTFMQRDDTASRQKKLSDRVDNKDNDYVLENAKKNFKMLTEKASHCILYPEKYKDIDPMKQYQEAKYLLAEPPLTNNVSVTARVILSYAHAMSYLETSKKKHVVKSIGMFVEIATTFKNVVFPLPHFGMGKAYMKMRRFGMVKKHFETALTLDTKPGCLTNCTWPGTNIIIDETAPGRLRKVIEGFYEIIKNDPPPDAECCFSSCNLERKIYFDELDFAGFYRVHCDSKHRVEFHTDCWFQNDRIQIVQGIRRPCLKSKCEGFVTLIESFKDNKKIPEIEYKDEKFKDLTSGPSASPKSKKKKKSKNNNNNHTSNTNAHSTLLQTNNTNDEDKENSQPSQTSSKSKKKKKKNGSNGSGGGGSGGGGSGPDSPDTIRRNASYMKYSKCMQRDFDFTEYESIIDNPQTQTFEMYFFVETVLTVNVVPFITIDFNKPIQEYISNLNQKSTTFLVLAGGIRGLLSKCSIFGLDERQFGVVYLTTRETEYRKFKAEEAQLLHKQPPICDDVLFSKDLLKDTESSRNIDNDIGGKMSIKSSRPKIEEIDGDDDEDDESEDSPPTAYINVGVQVGATDTEKEVKEKNLTDLNKKLLNETSGLHKEKDKLDSEHAKLKDDFIVNDIGGKKAIKSSRPKIEEIDGDDDEDEESEDSPPTVYINVGIQVGATDTEKEVKEKNLTDLNKKLLNEISGLRKEKDKLDSEHAKLKDDFIKLQTKSRSDANEFKNNAQLQRKEKKTLVQASIIQEEEIKKLRQNLEKKDELLKEIEQYSTEEIDGVKKELQKELNDVRKQLMKNEGHFENVIKQSQQNLAEETKRAERVEIALLESRRDLIMIKYQQQAHVIQNTINQMQFLSHLPEMVRLRKIWEDYKIEYQTSYEKMQEEFSGFIQSVRQGKRLESLPPSKYSHPPPYPQSPIPPQTHQTPNGTSSGLPLPTPHMLMQHHPHQAASQSHMNGSILGQPVNHLPPIQVIQPPPQIDIAAQLQAIIQPSSEAKNKSSSSTTIPTSVPTSVFPPAPPTEQKTNNEVTKAEEKLQPVAQAAYTTQQPQPQQQQSTPSLPQQQHSDSEDSEASNRSSEKEDIKYNKFFEKLILKLASKFPTAPRDDLIHYFNEYRKQGPLSGQNINDIVLNIEHYIRRKRRIDTANQPREPAAEKKKLPRVQGAGALNHGGTTKRQRANQVSAKANGLTSGNNIFGLEEPCVICYEDMQANNALLLHCGHTFHRDCIHCWLKEQRTCPVCRVLALLPDEYPALG